MRESKRFELHGGTIHEKLAEAVKRTNLSRDQIAERLGVNPRTLSYWLEGTTGHKVPTEALPAICTVIDDYSVLELLVHNASHVVFPIPRIGPDAALSEHDLAAVQSLMKEVGATLREVAATLEDGVVTRKEFADCERNLKRLIRESARLIHWLEEHHKADKRAGRVD